MAAPISPSNDPWSIVSTPTNYAQIRSQLNWWYQIKDLNHRKAFYEGNNYYSRTVTNVTILALAYLAVYLPMHCVELEYEISVDAGANYLISSIFILLFLLVDVLVVLLIILLTWNFKIPVLPNLHEKLQSRQSQLYIALFVSSTFYFILLFCKRNMFPLCSKPKSLWVHYNCASGYEQAQYIMYSAYNLYIVLLLFFINWQHMAIEVVWSLFAIQVGVGIGAIAQIDQPWSVALPFLFWTFAILAVILDVHLRNVAQYFSNVRERDQAQQFTSELKHTIANVAHDLKTPLASFTNGVDLLQLLCMDMEDAMRRQLLDQMRSLGRQIADCLSTIRCTTAFMTMAINRCLDSTKASNNVALVPKPETIDLMEVLGLPMAVINSVQTKINIRLDVESIDGMVATHLVTDKQWLQENVLCLLSNAVKYSFKGLVILRVLLSSYSRAASHGHGGGGGDREDDIEGYLDDVVSPASRPGQQELIFEVEDEGIGVKDALKDKLFRPIQPSQRVSGGLGLGLYSLAMRIEALKGRYGMMDRSDGRPGTIFWFSIPYQPDLSASRGQCIRVQAVKKSLDALLTPQTLMEDTMFVSTAQSSQSNQSSPKHLAVKGKTSPKAIDGFKTQSLESPGRRETKLKILVVDDAPTILKMLSAMLRRAGHEVLTAENGLQAVDAVANVQDVDLVLMDLQMPVMDGLEATRQIKASGGRVTVVGMSANSDSDTVAAAYQAGVNRFVPKPFSLDTFTALLSELWSK